MVCDTLNSQWGYEQKMAMKLAFKQRRRKVIHYERARRNSGCLLNARFPEDSFDDAHEMSERHQQHLYFGNGSPAESNRKDSTSREDTR
ncbi:hypothetical protein PUN28_007419 [Cardiocondyla obscurior]|uniref:Uncharacterized protein n=1 Tax=Cardiocondyla obscurior TaxID=286306 RepID=A0AAW2G678_9HYME